MVYREKIVANTMPCNPVYFIVTNWVIYDLVLVKPQHKFLHEPLKRYIFQLKNVIPSKRDKFILVK